MKIANKIIGSSQPAFIIAEVAQTHDGSLGMAHAFIDAVAEIGVDAIKFQTHIASEESTLREPWRLKFSHKDETRFQYWQRMEFNKTEWQSLKTHAEERGLIFMSSPFSTKAVDLLSDLDMACYKIGSGEIDNEILLERILKTGKPIIMSTGMSTYEEVDSIYTYLKKKNADFALLHCTSEYPVKAEKIGLNIIEEFKERYDCPVGFSSHVPSVAINFAAVVKGASILEAHVTLSKCMFGPDVSSSLTIEEFKTLVGNIREYEETNKHKANKYELAASLQRTKKIFRKSIVAANEITSGKILSLNDLAFKKPGDGLPVTEYKKLIGKKIISAKKADEVITLQDIEL